MGLGYGFVLMVCCRTKIGCRFLNCSRWQFKLDSKQVLKVTVKVVGAFKGYQSFFTRMGKDGKITIPKIPIELLKPESENSLQHYIMKVTLDPA